MIRRPKKGTDTCLIEWWLSPRCKSTSMSLGNQKGYFTYFNTAPPKINTKS